jgi:NAD(P)H-nitrite reductase large subunit
MELDDEVCLCFHVSKRKLLNHLRIHRPRRAGQLADCFGAGTGCGWCRGYLRNLFDAYMQGRSSAGGDVSAQEHARGRARYVRAGGGVPPPGATPIEEAED